MAHDDAEASLTVSVAYSPRAGMVDATTLQLAPGSTVADALRVSGLQARHPDVALGALQVGIWGALCERSDVLSDRDRVELYRPLLVDPKEARRQRQHAQGRGNAKGSVKRPR